jgi:hypothetical protein
MLHNQLYEIKPGLQLTFASFFGDAVIVRAKNSMASFDHFNGCSSRSPPFSVPISMSSFITSPRALTSSNRFSEDAMVQFSQFAGAY